MNKPNMVPHHYYGDLIFTEGADFAGKSTLVSSLSEVLDRVKVTKEPTTGSVPGRTVRAIYQLQNPKEAISELIAFLKLDLHPKLDFFEPAQKEILLDVIELGKKLLGRRFLGREELQYDPTAHMFLQLGMVLDRLYHFSEIIIPALYDGRVVISDRCCWSTVAYAKANNIDWQYLLKAHHVLLGDKFLEPDLILFLDVSPEIALARKAARKSDDLFEREKQIQDNIRIYRELYAQGMFPNVVRVDADGSEAEVLASALRAIYAVWPGKEKK